LLFDPVVIVMVSGTLLVFFSLLVRRFDGIADYGT